ncbi:MAG: hypothetical protein U0798_06925 [Gemmataceae bacterium]
MDCAEEVTVLKRELGPLVGGEEKLGFDVLNGKMIVPSESLSVAEIQVAVARTGMRAELWREETTAIAESTFWERNRRTVLTVASGGFLLLGAVTHAAMSGFRAAFLEESTVNGPPLVAVILYSLSILAGVWTVLPKAWVALKRFRPDMNLLMVVAVIGAVAIGQWMEAATVAFFFALSLALEAWSVGRARRAVAALMSLAPPEVRLLRADGGEDVVSPDQVTVGSKFRVRPGDRIPLDGRINDGTGGVDQSPITGESVPVTKGPGDEVFAGTINGEGSLTVESTKPASDTTLARITRMVGDAQTKRAPSEQWVEQLPNTPAVIIALAFLLFRRCSSAAMVGVALPSLVLLDIACPCTRVSTRSQRVVAAPRGGGEGGVLVGRVFVGSPGQLKAIAMG